MEESKFDGVIRCDITCDGISMTWPEYEHFREINDKIAKNPRNFIIGLLFLPLTFLRAISLASVMAGVGNRFIVQFIDPESKLNKFNSKVLKKLMCTEKYMDQEYKNIIEIPFWERHPERYTEEYIQEHDRF